MSALLERPVVAVASPTDAATTAAAIDSNFDEFGDVTVLHVIEKGGGAPDKASVEQREELAAETFEAFAEELGTDRFETDVVFATDVVDGIAGAATDADATAIVFTPREGGVIARLLSGDVSDRLVRASPVPVVVFPPLESES